MNLHIPDTSLPRVVIVGCGFGGLKLARELRNAPMQVVMIDRNNYHTFQPLLYQVSTAGLEADSIAYPIRKIFKDQQNFHYRYCTATRILDNENLLETSIGTVRYDYLVIATGSTTNFFNMQDIAEKSAVMKTLDESLNLRASILQKLEEALLQTDLEEQKALMTFVVVGGGPTGVELAGALCELKKHVLPADYPELDIRKMRVILIENSSEVLQNMSAENRKRALEALQSMGCEVWLNERVTAYDGTQISSNSQKMLRAKTLIWSAGVKGCIIDGIPQSSLQRGRILVDETNKVLNCANIYAIGDVACLQTVGYPNGHPMVAPVAMQQGVHLAKNLRLQLAGSEMIPFQYHDKGSMATIGRNRAVADLGKLKLYGWIGWVAWLVLHLLMLVGFRNKMVVLLNWVWNYLSYDRNIRLIIRPVDKA